MLLGAILVTLVLVFPRGVLRLLERPRV
jgi:hypothetical protein